MERNELIGVILCGGMSTRMGRDKGLIETNGLTWSQLAFQKLEPFSEQVVLAVNTTQEFNYLKFFHSDSLVIDQEGFEGPMKGLMSVHHQFPDRDLLILACDMIDIQRVTIQRLVDEHEPAKDITVFKNDGQVEPLCGVYTAKGLNKINALYEDGNIDKMSMMYFLSLVGTQEIEVSQGAEFKNYNTLS